MPYKIAGIDVHKSMLAVVVPTWKFTANTSLSGGCLAATPRNCDRWPLGCSSNEVEEVVMESTAQYWKPVWGALERYWKPGCQKREGAGPTVGNARIWRRHSRTAGGADARTISPTPNGWSSGWWLTNSAELCARSRTAPVADGHAHQVPAEVATTSSSRTGWKLCWKRRISSCPAWSRSSGRERAAHAAGGRRGGNRPGGAGRAGPLSLARHAGTVVRRAGRMPELHPVYRRW